MRYKEPKKIPREAAWERAELYLSCLETENPKEFNRLLKMAENIAIRSETDAEEILRMAVLALAAFDLYKDYPISTNEDVIAGVSDTLRSKWVFDLHVGLMQDTYLEPLISRSKSRW